MKYSIVLFAALLCAIFTTVVQAKQTKKEEKVKFVDRDVPPAKLRPARMTKWKNDEMQIRLVIDDSWSMSWPNDASKPEGKTRWDVMAEMLWQMVHDLLLIDDAIEIVPLNTKFGLFNRKKHMTINKKNIQDLAKFLDKGPCNAGTPGAEALEYTWTKLMAGDRDRRQAVLFLLDGAVDDPDAFKEVLAEMRDTVGEYHKKPVGVQMLSVGDDEKAMEFLDEVDHTMDGKNFIVDTRSGSKYMADGVLNVEEIYEFLEGVTSEFGDRRGQKPAPGRAYGRY